MILKNIIYKNNKITMAHKRKTGNKRVHKNKSNSLKKMKSIRKNDEVLKKLKQSL